MKNLFKIKALSFTERREIVKRNRQHYGQQIKQYSAPVALTIGERVNSLLIAY